MVRLVAVGDPRESVRAERFPGSRHHIENVGLRDGELLGIPASAKQHTYVMPLASVLASSAMGLLAFMSYGTGSANTVFQWLVNVTSVASLQSWAGMLFTYIRLVARSMLYVCG